MNVLAARVALGQEVRLGAGGVDGAHQILVTGHQGLQLQLGLVPFIIRFVAQQRVQSLDQPLHSVAAAVDVAADVLKFAFQNVEIVQRLDVDRHFGNGSVDGVHPLGHGVQAPAVLVPFLRNCFQLDAHCFRTPKNRIPRRQVQFVVLGDTSVAALYNEIKFNLFYKN